MPVQVFKPATAHGTPLRAFVYGALGRWKTSFAGSFPRPLFLSAGQEGGDRTLQVFPDVDAIRIATRKDMEEAVRLLQTQHRQRGWRTVVIDAVTFYMDIVIAELTGADKGAPRQMEQRDWGALEVHMLKWLMPTLHALPMHVVWIALEKLVKSESGAIVKIEPLLQGATSSKLPACCDIIFYADTELIVPPNGQGLPHTVCVMRTVPTGKTFARQRFWGAFPEGFVHPYFSHITARIGPQIGEAAPQGADGHTAQPAVAPR